MARGRPVAAVVETPEDVPRLRERPTVPWGLQAVGRLAKAPPVAGLAEPLELPGVDQFVADDGRERGPLVAAVGSSSERDRRHLAVPVPPADAGPAFRPRRDVPLDPPQVDFEVGLGDDLTGVDPRPRQQFVVDREFFVYPPLPARHGR